jgi:hypothetical protein
MYASNQSSGEKTFICQWSYNFLVPTARRANPTPPTALFSVGFRRSDRRHCRRNENPYFSMTDGADGTRRRHSRRLPGYLTDGADGTAGVSNNPRVSRRLSEPQNATGEFSYAHR